MEDESIHSFLKKFKISLIDSFTSLSARMEHLYLEAMILPNLLPKINEEWKNRSDLLEDINLIKTTISDLKGFGTWSYDFPEVIKLILVASATIIPLSLSILEISLFSIF